MFSFKAVIFDLDGVICSTDRYHFEAWKAIAARLHLDFDREKNNRLRGVSRMESLEIVLENFPGELSQKEKEDLASEKNKMYRKLLENMTSADISPGVCSVLRELRSAGILSAIGSSSRNASFILERLGLTGAFDIIVDGNDIKKSKPNPEVFLLAANKLKLSPGACLVVEDARAGIEAAKAGGFKAAAIGDAARYNLADYCLSDIRELVEIVLQR